MWAFTAPTQKIKPKVLGKVDIPIWNAEMKKPPVFRLMASQFGGADGTRTRDPRRDRPVF